MYLSLRKVITSVYLILITVAIIVIVTGLITS